MKPMERSDTDPLDMPEEWSMPFPREDWEKTPHTVRLYILALERKIAEQQKIIEALMKRVDELEARLNRNSSNSNQPPSADFLFKNRGEKGRTGKPGGKKGHKGRRQIMLQPGKTEHLKPKCSACGSKDFPDTTPYYTHQYIEFPEIEMEVTHFILHRGACPCCGKINKASLPGEYRIGYGPRLSAPIAQMAGGQGDSRTIVQEFCASILGIPICLGAIQKIIDRVSAAIEPHYEGIGEVAQRCEVNHVDETSFTETARFGKWALGELQRLCHMAHAPPTIGEWRAFYARLIRLITLYGDRKDETGIFARRLHREIDSLWIFLVKEGVSPTNNHAERMLRFAVLWRKRSYGTHSDTGERWVERILSLRQTCRLRSLRLYPVLVNALRAHFQKQQPDLAWISR